MADHEHPANLLQPDDQAIARAADILRHGGLVAFPTETVYGLGCNTFDPHAIARVFQIKGRPSFDPLIVHVADLDQARQLVRQFPDTAETLAEAFWPGPLTMVLAKADIVPDLVTSGLDTVAVRMPDHAAATALIEQAGTAVAAPSANRFGHISPTTAQHVLSDFGNQIEVVLDGGPCPGGLESTVISLVDDRPTLLRLGGVPAEQLEPLIGTLAQAQIHHDPQTQSPGHASPGMLDRHYAPRTALYLVDQLDGLDVPALGRRTGLLSLQPVGPASVAFMDTEVLSDVGDLEEAATALFAAMRRLDAASLDAIVALRLPDHGLGKAINDRLERAAHRRM